MSRSRRATRSVLRPEGSGLRRSRRRPPPAGRASASSTSRSWAWTSRARSSTGRSRSARKSTARKSARRSTARKGDSMRIRTRYWGLGVLSALAATLVLLAALPSSASDMAQHVRWDIVSNTGVPPITINPGGHASATAPNGGDTITLTGSGTFVAPVSAVSSATTGGGTWTTSSGGNGTYTVTGLVSWVNAGPQGPTTPPLIDNIDHGTRVNGTAVLQIAFSDGSEG